MSEHWNQLLLHTRHPLIRVAVTGAAGAIGSRVVAALATQPGVEVVAIDRIRIAAPAGVRTVCGDLLTENLKETFAGVAVVVHLAVAVRPADVDEASADIEMRIMDRVLKAATDAEVTQFVMLSTAMVYGAWTGNPVPITEDSAVNPNPDFGWAMLRAELERKVLGWCTNSATNAAILRPTAVVTDDDLGALAQVLHAARVGIAAEGDPPVQYLHVDDLVSAVVCVVLAGFDGIANVAPDGWIPPDSLHDLEGSRPRLRVPSWAAKALAAVRWRAGVAPIPPGIIPYTSHSWVVANDRIRNLGWSANYSNEEAWVVSHEPGPFDRIPAGRRQELILAAAASVIVSGAALMMVIIRRFRRGACMSRSPQ